MDSQQAVETIKAERYRCECLALKALEGIQAIQSSGLDAKTHPHIVAAKMLAFHAWEGIRYGITPELNEKITALHKEMREAEMKANR